MGDSIEVGLWLDIPISTVEYTSLRAWIWQLARTPELDNLLSAQCEEHILNLFDRLGLVYKDAVFGKFSMQSLRLQLRRNSILMPEICFEAPPENIPRVSDPL